MGAPIGNTYNLNGRPSGTPNKTTTKIKEIFASLLEGRGDEMNKALDRLRDKDPEAYLNLVVKISERFLPALSRQELTGADGTDFQPIQIILPNPKKDE
jgi:hypothetical protein